MPETLKDTLPDTTPRRALVLGGTGTVGGAVLTELARAGVPAIFTYHRSEDRARRLEQQLPGHAPRRAVGVDLGDMSAIRALLSELVNQDEVPDVVIHCAAIAAAAPLDAITDDDWARAQRIGCQSALVVCQSLAPHWKAAGRGDVVLVGALEPRQSLPLPIAFAATQGALAAMTMALCHELGPHGIRVNMVALGLLGEGLSASLGASALYREFERFSALRRTGTAEEAAKAITWLALRNEYMNGKVVPINGGI